jgi:Sigma-70, region 4
VRTERESADFIGSGKIRPGLRVPADLRSKHDAAGSLRSRAPRLEAVRELVDDTRGQRVRQGEDVLLHPVVVLDVIGPLAAQAVLRLLQGGVEVLPAPYRLVLVLRDVEGLNTAETAECLNLEIPAVKTRLHRARRMLRRRCAEQASAACSGVFAFDGVRCDRLVEVVLARIGEPPGAAP